MSTVEFYPLQVSVLAETDDSVRVTFEVPEVWRETFRHVPGQHLVLRAELDGEEVRRSYSVCTSAGSDTLSVGIKRIPGGVFSTYATNVLQDGDTIDVMAPIGDFGHVPDPTKVGTYVGLVAGSGITPVLSVLASILEAEPSSRCTLIYGNRTTTSIMFIEDLEALKSRYPERFQLVHVISREPNQVPLFQGRIDAEKLRTLSASILDVQAVDSWFLCGPLDMVETARETLGQLGVGEAAIEYELFFDERIDVPPAVDDDVDGLIELSVVIGGRTSLVNVDPNGPALLDYARSVRPEVPFACKGGMCATCKAKVVSGEVTMQKNYALTAEELAAGYILSCQSHPVDGDVAITFDVHGGVGR